MVNEENKGAKYEHVYHPSHYGGKDNPYEAIKVISSWLGPRGVFDFDLGNALKYICRAGAKPTEDGVSGLKRDLQKAAWYLGHAVKVLSFQMCLIKKDDGFDDVSQTQTLEEAASSGDIPDIIYCHGASRDVVLRLVKILATRPGYFLSMLLDTANDYEYKKGDKETSAILKEFRESCSNYLAELADIMRREEEKPDGDAGKAKESRVRYEAVK